MNIGVINTMILNCTYSLDYDGSRFKNICKFTNYNL